MSRRYLLCTDLDRTLLPNGAEPESEGARQVFARLVKRPEIQLAYVSGRSFELVREAIVDWQIPNPDYILGDVGTSIYARQASSPSNADSAPKTLHSGNGKEWARWQDWDAEIAPDWQGHRSSDIAVLLAPVAELSLQEAHKQSVFKTSFYASLEADSEALLGTTRHILMQAGIDASLIWSVDEQAAVGLLDVLPASATKKHAIDFLMQRQGFSLSDTVFAGDSGNDLPVLVSPIQSILVANASDEVRHAALAQAEAEHLLPSLYLARGGLLGMNGNYSAGIIEGFVHYLPQAQQWLQEVSP